MPPVDVYAVLQLQEDRYRLIPYAVGQRELDAFLHTLELYRWQKEQSRKIVGQDLTTGALAIA